MDKMTKHEITHLYGLIGFPLSHSFSKKYFSNKFQSLGYFDHVYELFPLESFERDFAALLKKTPQLKGLNVTIPFKELVIPYLDELDPPVVEIGAVNCIDIRDGVLKGYNTDVYGFKESLGPILKEETLKSALVLGTGGSSKAVQYVLKKLGFQVLSVSRSKERGDLMYEEINKKLLDSIGLIVNCTPLGMYPDVENCPDIPYNDLSQAHILFDLIYNPEKTLFLQLGADKNCTVKNGNEMLSLQAEKSWEIWKN